MASRQSRIPDFVEQPLFLFAVGVLAGIMGIFFFAPILAVCGLCKSLSVHRSGIIAHWSVLPSQFSAYGTLVIFIAVGLYFFNTAIQKRIGNAPQFPTANEIAAAVVSKSPQTPTTEQPLRSKSPGTDAKPLSSPNSERKVVFVLIPFNAGEGQPIPPYKSKTNAPPGFPSITFFYLPISRRASAILEGKEKPKSIEGILELLQELTRYEMLML